MKEIALITLLIFFFSCKRENSAIKLPLNSATLLLEKRGFNRSIYKSSSKNIDIINGFRGLKLSMEKDSLYLEDWNLNNYSLDINYFNKKVAVYFDGKAFKGEVYLTFYLSKLVMIDIELDDYNVLSTIRYSVDEARNTLIKPKLMDLFYNLFGAPIENYDNYLVSEKKLETLQKLPLKYSFFNKDMDENFEQVEKTLISFPKGVFIKQPYELITRKVIYSELKNKNTNNRFVGADVFYKFINNKGNNALYTYSGNLNKLKLLVQNNFERIDTPERGSNVYYKLKNIKTQIKVYNKKLVKKYILSKKKQESINFLEQERKFKEREMVEDSLKLKKSLENF
ncbi:MULTISPECIES: hypothetical protein [unclassified Polaribacter]|uniref:hypothetical protein n=1 Tax=unclassified Polaribacter TaxID=196858 RepID=UPI0011BF06C7|nr:MULTISPECIES: hypothetical protein [unclassified Polaribacter]TXD53594.1 hypothetical protein ES043_02925 [Polaribacter sp. IC063]TXD62165.1 hypothetical protein ES044_02780 [Polaribacter sp. IC066]